MGHDPAAGCGQHQTGYSSLSWSTSKAKSCFLSYVAVLAIDHCVQTRTSAVKTDHPEVPPGSSQTMKQVNMNNYCSSNFMQCMPVLGVLWSGFTHLLDFTVTTELSLSKSGSLT